jgi:acetyltransferase-like isoleucine patch superfamily enzyme
MIIDNDFHAYSDQGWRTEMQAGARPVKIGREVFVAARAIILKGVTIGDRAVIGAGAVVTKDVPADHVAAGNPASVFQKSQKS